MPVQNSEPQTTGVDIVQGSTNVPDDTVALIHPDPRIGQLQITGEQFRALRRKYEQSADGANSFEEFLTRVRTGGVGADAYILVRWCGMWLGIERDGYTHS